ncbi:MAG: hypothetical protein V9G20_17545 [Candidatus Promineifilaceae bacterium]
MYGLALCLPRVGQPQGLPVPHEILKTQEVQSKSLRPLRLYGENAPFFSSLIRVRFSFSDRLPGFIPG